MAKKPKSGGKKAGGSKTPSPKPSNASTLSPKAVQGIDRQIRPDGRTYRTR